MKLTILFLALLLTAGCGINVHECNWDNPSIASVSVLRSHRSPPNENRNCAGMRDVDTAPRGPLLHADSDNAGALHRHRPGHQGAFEMIGLMVLLLTILGFGLFYICATLEEILIELRKLVRLK